MKESFVKKLERQHVLGKGCTTSKKQQDRKPQDLAVKGAYKVGVKGGRYSAKLTPNMHAAQGKSANGVLFARCLNMPTMVSIKERIYQTKGVLSACLHLH